MTMYPTTVIIMEMIQIQNKSLARFSGSVIISFILKAIASHNRAFNPLQPKNILPFKLLKAGADERLITLKFR